MKTKAELEQAIISISLKIHMEFPELSKYIGEMPENMIGMNSKQLEIINFKDYYNSLEELLVEYAKTHAPTPEKHSSDTSTLAGYPLYPESEDIYNQEIEERDLNPEDISKKKSPNEKAGTSNEKGFDEDMSGDDLDVPGSELDDQQESIGSEDEENNYYSLGGDNHHDLDENKA
jgi:hypothetical protein